MEGERPRTPFFSALREKPRLPANLVRLQPRCEEDAHLEQSDCCYYQVLKRGGYSDRLIEKELARLADFQEKMAPAKVEAPTPELREDESAHAAWLRRRQRDDIGKETRVREDIRDSEPEPDGVYAVVDGERIPL